VSDCFFEYAGVPAERLEFWKDILKDVSFARGYGPSAGRPGHEEHERKSAQAIELLWTHLALLPRHLDLNHRPVALYLDSLNRTVEQSRSGAPRRSGRVSLDFSHLMNLLESLLLGLIGPEGQSPFAPHRVEIPTRPYFAAWLAAATGSADLLPGPAAARIVAWRTNRAVVLPAQAKDIAAGKPRNATLDDCRRVIEDWNRRSPSGQHPEPAPDDERARFVGWENEFRPVLAQLKLDLRRFADRGETYVGWTAGTDDE